MPYTDTVCRPVPPVRLLRSVCSYCIVLRCVRYAPIVSCYVMPAMLLLYRATIGMVMQKHFRSK
eukprot:2866264-Rhodomonas_salina.1